MVKTRTCLLLFLCILLPLPMYALAAVETEPPSFTALYRHWHEPSDTLLDEARITYSSQGLRVEQLIGDSGNVFIANYAEDALWFLDRKRHLVHAIPVIESPVVATDEATDPAMVGAVQNQPTQASRVFSKIQVEPCEGLEKVSLGSSVFQGRAVQRWSCLFDGESVEEHWYTENPGVVVRIATRDGFVSELTEIHKRHAASAYFRPPSHYRPVEIEELINPAVPISSYIEKKNGQL